jgi:hypothetical protein
MTIRVLDDAVYEEYLQISARHQGVVLEAAGQATIWVRPDQDHDFVIRDAPGFTLRRFHFISSDSSRAGNLIHIAGRCPGLVLDRLTMTGVANLDCIDLYSYAEGTRDDPIVIQNCTFQGEGYALHVEGRDRGDPDRPMPCGHVVIRNNRFLRTVGGVGLQGTVHQVLVAGNHLVEVKYGSIDLFDPLPGTADVLIANNTVIRGQNRAIAIWDDHEKGKVFLKCRAMRCQNNLVLEHLGAADMRFLDHQRTNYEVEKAGDLESLRKSPEWHFSHNWREGLPPRPEDPIRGRWIPPGRDNHLQALIEVLSRQSSHASFLRPPKGSPLATGGAGVSDPSLPAYVGAVPPEGVEPWDWEKTWKALMR